jgi:hypothetical protein
MWKKLPVLFTLLLPFSPAGAYGYDDTIVGVQLDWNRYDSTLNMGATQHETRLTHVSMVLYEPSWRYLYGGLRVGYADVSQPDNPDLAGLHLYGNSLGILLGMFLMRNDYLDINFQGDYSYLQTSSRKEEQEADFNWAETNFQLGAKLKLGLLRLSGATYRYGINGDQKLRGDINSTTRFGEAEKTGTSIGIELQVDPTGYVGIHAENGAREGVRMLFTREF